MIDEEQLNICHECVGDEFLKKEIKLEGKIGKCSYCEKSCKIVHLPWLADKIHTAIDEHFNLTSNEPTALEHALLSDKESTFDWERSGEEFHCLIQEMAEVNERVATDVQAYLSFYFGGDPRDFEENPYGEEACYEECPPDTYGFKKSWRFFRQEITYRTRFFSQFAEQTLNELFCNIDLLKTYDGKSVISIAGPSTENQYVFRARVSQTHDSLDQILKDPVKELSSPPPKYAKNGRMNAHGISVFYGATDSETCIAEVRPPVGSHVVLGKFQILKNIRLLDLNILSRIYINGSYFAPDFKARKGHAAFLQDLVGELTKPVMPEEENFEYLPTQIVAEYLAEKVKPNLDGIIFNSSQSQENEQNIILFHNSCAVEPYKLPTGSTVSVNYGRRIEDDYDDSITVFEEYTKSTSNHNDSEHINITQYNDDDYNNREPILRLDVNKDISVRVIKRAVYESSERYVSRYKQKKLET
ncbi:MAG: RES family NAD+ phosphorylase [Kiritimatiellae bacterium]|jgi:hypothetical protein|nr:RES family NAD+ phosphorylase [Kiritimatiellia bacterium]